MESEDDIDIENINNFVPSVLHPRSVRRSNDPNLSQMTTSSRFSLSLKKPSRKVLHDISQPQNSAADTESQNITMNVLSKNCPIFIPVDKTIGQKEPVVETLLKPREVCSKDAAAIEYSCNFVSTCCPPTSIVHLSGSKKLHRTSTSIEEAVQTASESDNIEEKSIHSCSTLLYDPFGSGSGKLHHTIQTISSKQSSICTISTENHLVLNIDSTPTGHKITTKRKAATDKDIKKKKKSNLDNSLLLILNKTAVKDYSKIIFDPPNFKLVKRNKTNDRRGRLGNLQQKITGFFRRRGKQSDSQRRPDDECVSVCGEEVKESALEVRDESVRTSKAKNALSKRSVMSPHRVTSSRVERAGSMAFTTSTRSVPKPTSPTPLPPHKIIQGTHFAVDAFCYGSIPNVKVYFLTHFHSDHYMGLRKSFSNTIYCSKITGDLCIMRLGINPKCIKHINPNERLVIDGIEVSAMDANHCPGSIMLVFSLRNGTNILHCGDFRASHAMESDPVFWNKDIHTVYLDTTYCNPRYDFPTQDESIEMAVSVLHRKKSDLKRKHKNFAKVLIVCGAYTIGKENFFIRLAERMECAIWAGPEKDAILRTALGRSFAGKPPQHCQIHVLDMRLITHKDLKAYLESMGGVFSEVIAFKPSGWESSSKQPFHADNISIYGIPYSEHSSFTELLRFVQFLRPKLVIPTVPIAGGIKSVQKYFPCPLSNKEDFSQRRISDYFTGSKRSLTPAIT